MSDSLFSELWYRVSNLKPRIRGHAEIHHHTYRGRDWYVLQDHSSGRFHRFSREAYHIIGLMDGRRPLAEIWEAACANLGDDMPTQDEVIRLLAQLHQADVLQSDIPPDIADLYKRHKLYKRNRLLGQLKSPLFIKIPLIDPERFLSATAFLIRPILGWTGFILWCVTVISALILVVINWAELTSNLADRVLAMENLFLLWLIYPVVKAIHEFGHAYMVKRWGGEVHEMGIMLLVFVPVPYLDASSSSALKERYKRILVDGAGIMIEVFLAAIAMWIWVNAEPGAVRALTFNIMIIAGVSTLLFNGNPLLRFDAYYILSDFLEIPNLASRSNRYLGYVCQRYLFNIEEAQNPVTSPGETPWMVFYGIASFLYRVFIMVRIAMFVSGKFFIMGVLLAIWGFFGMLIMPLLRTVKYLFTDTAMRRRRKRVLAVLCPITCLLLLLVIGVPIPSLTVVEGILWAPENARVYAGADGFIKEIRVDSGKAVKKGDHLIICENPDLSAEVRVLEAELNEYETRHRQSMTENRTQAEILKDEIGRIKAELDEKRKEKEDLTVRSPENGIFVIPDPSDMPGRFVRRGLPIGYVVDFERVTALVVIPQRYVDMVRNETKKVTARLAGSLGMEHDARIKREVPAASSDLPSLALSLEGGGSLALDPREREKPTAFEKLFHFEVIISGTILETLGERVFVRFEHNPEPVIFRWYRGIRRTLLDRFNV
ncbi:MAG: efflux RND transporter periplasmic adaptor subunit [Deltaproteobacteria bacterium]|nr:efflux RND transporter periplasmic adaptor subunit [Deltaproteobacteria bacterium]